MKYGVFYSIILLFVFTICSSAQEKEKILFKESCTITLKLDKPGGLDVNSVIGELRLTEKNCSFGFDSKEKVIVDIDGINIQNESISFPLTRLYDFKLKDDGKSLTFLKKTDESPMVCKIDSPNAEKIMKKIIELQKEAK